MAEVIKELLGASLVPGPEVAPVRGRGEGWSTHATFMLGGWSINTTFVPE